MTENLERLKKLRTAHRTVATRLNNEAKTITNRPGQNVSEEELIRLEQISTLLTKNLIDDTDRLDEEIEESEDYDDKVGQHVDLINRVVMYKRTPARSSTPRLASGPAITNVKLPKPELPIFCVDYKDWTSFFDQFNGAVTSSSQVTESQKLQYLKTSVKGDAAKLFTSVQITDANFSRACDIPRNRYDNKRLILRAHVHAIVSQKPVTNENAKPKSHGDRGKTKWISAQQPWTGRRRSGHHFCVPHCREIARRNEKTLGTFITRKKFPTLSWYEKIHGRKNTRPWSSHTAVNISHRQEAHKQLKTSKIPFKYSHISNYNVWMLRQKPQNLSMPKFQSTFSTGPSSVDQEQRTLLQLPAPWTSKWTMQLFNL